MGMRMGRYVDVHGYNPAEYTVKIFNIRRTKLKNCFSSRLAIIIAQSIEVRR